MSILSFHTVTSFLVLLFILFLSRTSDGLCPKISRRALLSSSSSLLLPFSPSTASAATTTTAAKTYSFEKSDREWQYILSGQQYNILRKGGTEPPYASILENEKRAGTFICAGCRTPLFDSSAKFNSGTGWPSFATALPGVEVTSNNPAALLLTGIELKCGNCGGHLGDVFGDGVLFPGTPAAVSKKRHCIDGYSLIFVPENGGDEVIGDTPGRKKEMPKWMEPPSITPRQRS